MSRSYAALVALAALPSAGAAEPVQPPLVVYAAGSATGVLNAMLERYKAATGETVTLRTGPADRKSVV